VLLATGGLLADGSVWPDSKVGWSAWRVRGRRSSLRLRICRSRRRWGASSLSRSLRIPPGIPVLAPGEVVGPEVVEFLQAGRAAGMRFNGASDPALATLRVVRA